MGYEEGGQLTEAVRRRPYSVILLDEIEEAHPEAFNMLLQIMEDGYLSDAKGRRWTSAALILMTSNIGAKLIQGANKLASPSPRKRTRSRARTVRTMKGEGDGRSEEDVPARFLNRLDGVMVFRSLSAR